MEAAKEAPLEVSMGADCMEEAALEVASKEVVEEVRAAVALVVTTAAVVTAEELREADSLEVVKEAP